MDRRLFLRSLVGGSAVALAPSLVWPFRKIFLPAITIPFDSFWYHTWKIHNTPDAFAVAAVQAVELEAFAKELPMIFYKNDRIYSLFKKGPIDIHWDNLRVPIQVQIV